MKPRTNTSPGSHVRVQTAAQKAPRTAEASKPRVIRFEWTQQGITCRPPAPSLNRVSLDGAFIHALRAANLLQRVHANGCAGSPASPRTPTTLRISGLDLRMAPRRPISDDAIALRAIRASHYLSMVLDAVDLAQPRFVSMPTSRPSARPTGEQTTHRLQHQPSDTFKRTFRSPELKRRPRDEPVEIYRRDETAKPVSLDVPEPPQRSWTFGKPIVHEVKPGLPPKPERQPLPLPRNEPVTVSPAAVVQPGPLAIHQPRHVALKEGEEIPEDLKRFVAPYRTPEQADAELASQQALPAPDYAAYAAAAAELANEDNPLAAHAKALSDNGTAPAPAAPEQAPVQPAVDPVYAAYLAHLEHMKNESPEQ